MIHKLSYILVFLFLILLGCSEKEEVLDEETYSQLMLEFTIVNQMEDIFLRGETREELHEKIFTYYNVDREEFSEAHEFYQQDTEAQIARMEEVGIRLRQERDSVRTVDSEYRMAQRAAADSIRNRILNSDDQDEDPDSLKSE